MTLTADQFHQLAREALKYRTPSDWKHYDYWTYAKAERLGLMDDLLPARAPEAIANRYFSFVECKKHGNLYGTEEAWKFKRPDSYRCARVNGWIREIYPPAKFDKRCKPKEHTLQKAKEVSVLREDKTEWSKLACPLYEFVFVNGWVGYCETKEHLSLSANFERVELQSEGLENLFRNPTNNRKRSFGRYEDIFIIGSLYPSRTAWASSDSKTFHIAKKKGWLDRIHPQKTLHEKKELTIKPETPSILNTLDISQRSNNTVAKQSKEPFRSTGLELIIKKSRVYKTPVRNLSSRVT